jgi:chromosome segregation protein
MHLKGLTILGFKSFADKTSLTFQPGITCIVGPNGCGKSNVADAVRWVLGEQSAKALRGGEMADVIFNGTDARKPLGMAEVSLTITDVDEDHLRAAGVDLAYNEITVTRRVFRDGGSEYYINRTPCRLKDIQQLFLGTGVGRASYSIMAQGNITQILSSKPEDRRMVFEEAAGITRFKSQKREALRKLEHTEQNLLRISDLIREVKRQIGSLQRQAGKARRYRALQQELQHLDTQLARHQFDTLQAEIEERTATLQQLRQELEHTSDLLLREENEILQLRSQLSELEHEISQTQQRGLELRNQAERHEHRIQFNEERLQELQNRHTAALNDIAQAEERQRAATAELESLQTRIQQTEAGLDGLRETFQQRQQAVQNVESQLQQRRLELEETQANLFQAAQHLSRLRNEINALDLHRQGNLVRLEKLSSEKIQLEEERTHSDQRLQEFMANVEAERSQVHTQRVSVEEQQQRLQDLHRRLEQAAQELETLVQQQAALRSSLGVLEQLQSEHEGFGPGTLAALEQTELALGSLADRIRVPDPYVTAVEHALGHHLQLVLAREPNTARQILSTLATDKKGRASVVPLEWQHADPSEDTPPIPDCPHGQSALSVIEADPEIRPLLHRLLARTRIVTSLDDAAAAWANGGNNFDYVTSRGELLSRHGVFTGGDLNGSSTDANASSILGRKNQIAQLQQQLAELQDHITAASRSRGQWLSEQTSAQAALQTDQNTLRASEVAVATHEGEVTALQNASKILNQKIETVVFEIQSLAQQEEEGQQKRTALAADLSAAEQEETTRQQRLNELAADLESLRQQRESTGAALTEVRVSLATEEQLLQSLQRQCQPLELRRAELQQLATERRASITECLDRQSSAEAEISESRQRIDTLHHGREQIGRQAADLDTRRTSLETDIASREDGLRAHRQQLSQLQERRSTLEVELAQKEMGTENLRNRIREKYQINLDDIPSECITITFADQGPPKIQTLTPEEMAQAGASTDWNAIADQVAALEKRLGDMGPVNMVAIEEYEETEQRYQFLSQQHDDLVNAKNELHEVLTRINTQTRTMFLETFEKIRENFRGMFTEVFGGGKADLRLVNEGDVLESGIDIVARPPGKQLQTISLLSGGEQTMTAVALLFAIYQVKPSPFCVLDELDAPLDESNINRFIRILQRFLEKSQFIIITHNKRTIGMADVLYGVTMPDHGISKIVSVKFHKTDGTPVEHEGPAPTLLPGEAPNDEIEQSEDASRTREETLEIVH